MSSNSYPQPYPGAPPIPQGYNVNPTQWNAGVWQRNPHFNWNQSAAQAPQASWVPGQAWSQSQQQQQQQQSYNPYKRVVNPPSAQYLAQKLSDNPLGLTNMIPREELYGPGVDGAPPETPWIWAPRNLDDEDSPDRPNNLRQSSEPPLPPPSTQSYPLSRHASEPPPDNQGAPAPLARPKKYAVSASVQAAAASRTSQPPPPQPPPTSSASAYASSRAAAAASASSGNALTNAVMSPPRALRTTFSTRIVRTPDHYRASHADNPSQSPPNSSLTRSATMPSVTSAMNQMSVSSSTASQSQTTPSRSQSTSQATRRSTSASASTSGGPKTDVDTGSGNITNAAMFVDEPGTLLSPLVMETPMPSSTKPLGRHHTEPSLSAIPESSERHRSHHHHHHHKHRSASRNDSSSGSTPSKSKTPTPAAAPESGSTSYFSSSRSTRAGTATSSASASAAAAAKYMTPPNSANNSVDMPAASLSAFGNRPPNPLPTPPRAFDMNPSYSRANMYSPPNSAGATPSKGVGSSSTTITYTSPPASAPAHGSFMTNYGIIPAPSSNSSSSTITPTRTSTGISSASASAAASASAQTSSRSRSHTHSSTPDRRERESPRSRDGGQVERSYSSREPSRSREPSSSRHGTHSRTQSREPSASRYSSDRSRPANFAPDGLPPAAPTQENEARILSDLSSRYTIHGEPPKTHRGRYENRHSSSSTPAPVADASAPPGHFEHFPLPTPPESYFEQKRREAAQEREQQQQQQQQPPAPAPAPQQSTYYRHSTSSYQTPKTSPYSSTDPSPRKSPSYPQQRQYSNGPSPQTHSRSASRHTSPYPSPNDAPMRSPYPSPYSNASSAQPSPRPSPTKASHASRSSYSSYPSTAGGSTTAAGTRDQPRRKGFWNSRGDHLTATGFIVYAPADKANPPELANYPGQWSGYMDENGNIAKFEVGRTELPESLPKYGMPPERPYDSFIHYVKS
ncbi:hypothetical protein GYMLUDRAFT_34588 [Collybiopsis luxurians FD-317 M1]|nr:hypothetical protein GYMLUDRAFT_34588 [Collybiopsis luxurians FD-317 M1]